MPIDSSLSELQELAHPSPPALAAGRARKDNDEISLLDLLIVLAERKHIILGVTVAFAVLAIVIALILPKQYTANVVLLPPQQGSSMGSAIASQLGNLGGMAALAGGSLGLKSPNDMYIAMLKSRTVEDAMVQHFGLMQEYKQKYLSDTRKAFERHATIDGNGKDGLIHISIEDRDPNRAAQLANGYVDQFRKLSEHLAITEASQRRLFFEQQLEQAKNNLANAEEALKETQQKTGLIQLDSQARALIESAAALRAQIAAKEVQIQSMRTFATGENAQLIQAEQELDGLRTQLARLGGSGNIDAGLMVPKGQVPEAGLEYMRKLRDVKYYETIFDILARQFEIAKLDEAKEGALVQVVDPAVPPDKRSFPKRGMIVIAATAAGFFVGIIVAMAHALFANINLDSEQAVKFMHLKEAISIKRRVSQAPLSH
jgi:uncharacterized protein involved in exopolysaccharide biosynthesis